MQTLDDDDLRRLAPVDLPSYRASRATFRRSVPLELFSTEQSASLRTLYARLDELMKGTRDAGSAGDPDLLGSALLDAVEPVRRIRVPQGDRRVNLALHDVRGGALASLTLLVAYARVPERAEATRRALHFLSRDHLKIMRSALSGLDAQGEARDRELRPHALGEVLAGARDALLPVAGTPHHVELHLGFEGTVAASCMETAAIRRVLYNLLNNAAAHASAPPVRVFTLAVPSPSPASVRIVVANPIDRARARALAPELRRGDGAEIPPIWGDYTTTGSGLGLRSVLATVADAHGLPHVADAVANGYVGATLVDGAEFVAWFHWPLPQ